MNQLLSSLDAVFGNTFPICGDPRALYFSVLEMSDRKEDQCTKMLKEDYSQLYNKKLGIVFINSSFIENYKAISTVRVCHLDPC